jgi:hypothetical protein
MQIIERIRNLTFNLDYLTIAQAQTSPNSLLLYKLETPQLTTINKETDSGYESNSVNVEYEWFEILSLTCFVDINSLQAVEPYIPEPLDSASSERINRYRNDASFPYYGMVVIISEQGRPSTAAKLPLQNKRPGYYLDLIRFLSSQNSFYGGRQTELRIDTTDEGFGVPAETDTISFYGQIREVGYAKEKPISVAVNSPVTVTTGGGGTGGGGETDTRKTLPSFDPSSLSLSIKLESYYQTTRPTQVKIYFSKSFTETGGVVEVSSAAIATHSLVWTETEPERFDSALIQIGDLIAEQGRGLGFYFLIADSGNLYPPSFGGFFPPDLMVGSANFYVEGFNRQGTALFICGNFPQAYSLNITSS